MYQFYRIQEAKKQASLLEKDLQKAIPLLTWRVECDLENWPSIYFNIIGTVEINGQRYNGLKQVAVEKYYHFREQGYWTEWIRDEMSYNLASFIMNWKPETIVKEVRNE